MTEPPSPPPPGESSLLALRRIEPSLNMARFYVLTLEPTLFGEVAVMRHWGRIGTHGRQKSCYVGPLEDARVALAKQADRKRRRGYVATGPTAGRD